MIDIKTISITNDSDYDKIQGIIKPEYYSKKFIDELKQRIGIKCDKLIVEYPYYDKDYLSTYYAYYSKLFKKANKKCYRIHIFNNDKYYGYITLRSTIYYTKVGKSYIDPKLLLDEKAYVILSKFKTHLIGHVDFVEAYPWMYQETDIAVCAHVATWSIIRYYGNRFNDYSDKTMMRVVELTPNGSCRNIPSRGLNIPQIAEILKSNGFHPIIIGKNKNDKGEFFEEVISYIESGIPLVGVLSKKGHAVAINGHGKLDFSKIGTITDTIFSNSNFIDGFIVNDDNFFPYLHVKNKGTALNKIQEYDLEDIDYVIVPLYKNMMLGYWTVKSRAYGLINSKIYVFNDRNVVRIYMTSSNSLKERTLASNSINSTYKEIICRMQMPRFIWCVDIASPEEYVNGKMSCRLILDSTAGTYEVQPWLLIQDKTQVIWKDDNVYRSTKIDINPYDIYINNLKEI